MILLEDQSSAHQKALLFQRIEEAPGGSLLVEANVVKLKGMKIEQHLPTRLVPTWVDVYISIEQGRFVIEPYPDSELSGRFNSIVYADGTPSSNHLMVYAWRYKQPVVRLCDWCKVEGREVPIADPPRTHINGKYEEDFLCEGCAAWLDEGMPTVEEWGDGFSPIVEIAPKYTHTEDASTTLPG